MDEITNPCMRYVTFQELIAIRNGLIYEIDLLRWYEFSKRLQLNIAINVVNAILQWVSHGKATVRVGDLGGE